ncbi:MAG TPA: glycosyltransferase family 9 protein, partial [Herpetosiphonaceae bacterium]|nr:glycosyltransferase family 9 protein [Herpetosiphonaceae bacterium]
MQRLRRLLLRLAALALRVLTEAAPEPRRVLVIKPDHLGDLLLLTPALQRLRDGLPGAHVSLLVGPWAVEAVRGNPDVDAVLVCPFPGFTRRPKPSLLQPYTLLLRTALLLRAGHYDVALIARDDHWWGALLALVAGIPRRIGYAAPDVAALLTEKLPYDPEEHVALQGLALVDCLTNRKPETLPVMRAPITPDDEAWARAWLQAHGVEDNQRLVAIHPGSGGQAKLWLSSRWGMIADALMEDGRQVLLTGGPSERALIVE